MAGSKPWPRYRSVARSLRGLHRQLDRARPRARAARRRPSAAARDRDRGRARQAARRSGRPRRPACPARARRGGSSVNAIGSVGASSREDDAGWRSGRSRATRGRGAITGRVQVICVGWPSKVGEHERAPTRRGRSRRSGSNARVTTSAGNAGARDRPGRRPARTARGSSGSASPSASANATEPGRCGGTYSWRWSSRPRRRTDVERGRDEAPAVAPTAEGGMDGQVVVVGRAVADDPPVLECDDRPLGVGHDPDRAPGRCPTRRSPGSRRWRGTPP